MAHSTKTMTLLAFPQELCDLIYAYLTTSSKDYSITSSANGITTVNTSEPNFGIINTCRTIQRQMLGLLSPHNRIMFHFPCSGRSARAHLELAPFVRHMEIYIDFEPFHWSQFRVGHHEPEIQRINKQVCHLLRVWDSHPIRFEFCQITIKDNNQFTAPLLRQEIWETVKTLVEVETLVIVVTNWKPDIWKLRNYLRGSLGPSTLLIERPPLLCAERHFASVRFRPKRYVAEQSKIQICDALVLHARPRP